MENTQTQGFSDHKTQGKIIFVTTKKFSVRILRPWELTKLIDAIPKDYCKTQYEFLLYSGTRYIEAQNLFGKKDLFDGRTIHLIPGVITKKPKCTITSRYINLTPVGRRVTEDYFKLKKPLPHMNVWRENLIRWATEAEIDPSYLSVKTTRKTYESFLMSIYPERRDEIFISQGHNELTALKHYVNLPFEQEDKKQMIHYVSGWGE